MAALRGDISFGYLKQFILVTYLYFYYKATFTLLKGLHYKQETAVKKTSVWVFLSDVLLLLYKIGLPDSWFVLWCLTQLSTILIFSYIVES
jgi:hypothetical protein